MKEETPDCAGYWVAGVTCDGGINQSGEEEVACSWRKNCRIIQDYLIKTGTDPQSYRGRYGVESFNNLLNKIEKESKKKRKKRKYVRKKPLKKKKRKKKITPEQRKKQRYEPLKEMVLGPLSKALEEACDGVKLVWCHRKTEAVRAGCLYWKDRVEASRAYTLRLRRVRDRPLRLAIIKLKPFNKGLDVQIRAKEKPKDLPSHFRWVTWVDPPMHSGIKTLRTKADFVYFAKYIVQVAKDELERS